MRMFFLDCGIMKFPYSVIARDMQPQDDSHKMVPAPISAFLIEHPEGRILFDTGCDPDGMKGKWPDAYRQIPYQESYLPQQLDELGVKPDDIGYVVASHLHFDHAGCLHICNKARIYVNKTELDTTMDAYRNGRDLNAHLPSDIENWMRADLTWEPVSSETAPLVDGEFRARSFLGHAWTHGRAAGRQSFSGIGRHLHQRESRPPDETAGPAERYRGIPQNHQTDRVICRRESCDDRVRPRHAAIRIMEGKRLHRVMCSHGPSKPGVDRWNKTSS